MQVVAATLQQVRSELPGGLRRWLFGISVDETSVRRRGFSTSDTSRKERIEDIGGAFVEGYQAALATNGSAQPLLESLNQVPNETRGFGFEGAAMALAILDYTTPWNRSRSSAFMSDIAGKHIYVAHVGVGWAIARMRGNISKALRRLDPLLKWLAVDGIGFHEGFFHWPRSITRQLVPRRISGYGKRAFDQGLGRSLWFVNVADPTATANTIDQFHSSRQAVLWAGAGLASAYAGGESRVGLEILCDRSGAYRPELAQGAAFAAKTRLRAGNRAIHTDLACEIFCGLGSGDAAAVTDSALVAIRPSTSEPEYETWRREIQLRIQSAFS